MLSLKRFTSLVRWKLVGDGYRPVRASSQSTGISITLRSTQYGNSLSQNEWLWTAASDKTITVGWIVRNFPHDYGWPERDDIYTTSTVTPPWLDISGLTSGVNLELVWFDDHRGKIIGSRPTTTSGGFLVQLPDTDTTPQVGFGKSVAFLIQPIGLTPNTSFEALPNPGDRIGQIVVSPVLRYHDEHTTTRIGTQLTFRAVTKPEIPPQQRTNYIYHWAFGDKDYTEPEGQGLDVVTFSYPDGETCWWKKVELEIMDLQRKPVSGDIVYIEVYPRGNP